MEFIKNKKNIINEYFHITGNENDCSYYYCIELQNIKIKKFITIGDYYNYCGISIQFPSYEFIIKYNCEYNEITDEFLKNYIINIDNNDYMCILIIFKDKSYEPILFNDDLFIDKLTNIYYSYYNKIENLKDYKTFNILKEIYECKNNLHSYKFRRNPSIIISELCYDCKKNIEIEVCYICKSRSCDCGHPCGCSC